MPLNIAQLRLLWETVGACADSLVENGYVAELAACVDETGFKNVADALVYIRREEIGVDNVPQCSAQARADWKEETSLKEDAALKERQARLSALPPNCNPMAVADMHRFRKEMRERVVGKMFAVGGGTASETKSGTMSTTHAVLGELIRLRELWLEQTPTETTTHSFFVSRVPLNLGELGDSAPLAGEIREFVTMLVTDRVNSHKAPALARASVKNAWASGPPVFCGPEFKCTAAATTGTVGAAGAVAVAAEAVPAEESSLLYQQAVCLERDASWTEAWPLYVKARAAGSPHAAYKVALGYFHGMGVVKIDYRQGQEALKEARGVPGSTALLASTHECGWGVKRSTQAAVDVLAADYKDPLAGVYLYHFVEDKDVKMPSDVPLASDQLWDQSASRVHDRASQGDAHAQYMLGWDYRLGKAGFPECMMQAIHWFSAAASQGCARSQARLGHAIAMRYAQLFSEPEHEDVSFLDHMARMQGHATAQLFVRALYAQSAEQNCSVACFYLGQLEQAGGRTEEARALYKRAIAMGLWEAQDALGKL